MQAAYFENINLGEFELNSFAWGSGSEDFPILAHWHYYIEAIFVLEGEANIYINGASFRLPEGGLAFFNSRDVHAINETDGHWVRYIVLKFPTELCYRSTGDQFAAKYVLPFTVNIPAAHKVFLPGALPSGEIPGLMHRCLEEYQGKGFAWELSVRSAVERFYLHMLRYWNSQGIDYDMSRIFVSGELEKLEKCFLYMSEHFREHVSVHQMAAICNLSYSYFSRVFKRITGRSFTEYTNYLRISEAERLLLGHELDVMQIALSTGFSDANYFIKLFKQHKGITPWQYRKRFSNFHLEQGRDRG